LATTNTVSKEQSTTALADATSKTEAPVLASKTEKPAKKEKASKKKTSKQSKETASVATSDLSTNEQQSPTEKPQVKKRELSARASVAVEGFTFQVQIVACRVPLTQETLQGIYNGTEAPIETLENSWYKYSVGNLNTYADACNLRDQLNIPGAFVVAFLNGKKINVNKALVPSSSEAASIPYVGASNSVVSGVVFKIQVIASRKPIDEKELSKIYNGDQKLESIEEDSLIKYLINCGTSYNATCKLLDKLSIPGAFIVAYNEGQKISVKEALKLKK